MTVDEIMERFENDFPDISTVIERFDYSEFLIDDTAAAYNKDSGQIVYNKVIRHLPKNQYLQPFDNMVLLTMVQKPIIAKSKSIRQQATGNRQQATGNYTPPLTNRVNNPTVEFHPLIAIISKKIPIFSLTGGIL